MYIIYLKVFLTILFIHTYTYVFINVALNKLSSYEIVGGDRAGEPPDHLPHLHGDQIQHAEQDHSQRYGIIQKKIWSDPGLRSRS